MRAFPIRNTLPLLIVALGLASLPTSAAVLEEVLVTAQKRSQSVQDIGIAVTAFTGEQLEQLGYDNAQQVTRQSPGVTTIQPNGPSAFFISIRGVGQNDFSGDHQESPVAIYLDEAYISAASGAGFQLFDMERVEVLRGPQGTLFGRNATGGLAHYITKKPGDEFDGYFDLTYADYEQFKFEGAIGGPLSDGVSARLSFLQNKHDPYIDNRITPVMDDPITLDVDEGIIDTDLNNGDDWALRGQLKFDFTNATWLLSARQAEQDIDTGFFKHRSAQQNDAGLGDFRLDEFRDGKDLQGEGDSTAKPYSDSSDDVHSGEYNVIGHNRLETSGFTSNLNWRSANLELVIISDYWTLEKDYLEDSDASPNNFFAFYLKSDLEQFSQEIRLSGGSDRLRWVVGVYYLDIDGDFENGGAAGNFFAAAFPGEGLDTVPNIGLYNPFTTKTESLALFGQMEFDIGDNITVIAGLRGTREEKEIDFKQYAAEFANPRSSSVTSTDILGLGGPLFTYNSDSVTNAPGGTGFGAALRTGTPGDATREDDLVTAKLELDWRVDDRTLLYLSYNRGIKGGGYNAPLDATDFYAGTRPLSEMRFDEEVLHAWESGFKWASDNGLARVNGAVYYYDYQDYQAFDLEALTTVIFNTDATVYGAEIELQATPAPGLDLVLGAAWIDNTVSDAYTPKDAPGSRVDRTAVMTPELSFNGLIRYEWSAFSGTLAVQADFNYLDEHFFQLKNSPVGQEDAYVLSNARVSWTSGDQQWDITAFIDNLTDEEYRVMVFDLAAAPPDGGFGLAENYYGPPRWWGVTLGYNW